MVGCKVCTFAVAVGILCALCPVRVQAQQTSDPRQSSLQTAVSRRALQELVEQEPLRQSVLRFDSVDARFPQLAQEDAPYPVRYTFTNTGREPLRIDKVTVSCGCLSVEVPERTIPAGGRGSLTVRFHPKGYSGTVYRQAWVYTSLSDRQPTQRLSLTGQVLPPSDPWYRYPHRLGLLRAKQREVTFRPHLGGSKLVEAVAVVNGGELPLSLSAAGLPPYLTFATTPSVVQPGQEADLLFTLHPGLLPPEVRQQGARLEVEIHGAAAPGQSAAPRVKVVIAPSGGRPF